MSQTGHPTRSEKRRQDEAGFADDDVACERSVHRNACNTRPIGDDQVEDRYHQPQADVDRQRPIADSDLSCEDSNWHELA